MATAPTTAPGIIDPDALYTKPEAMARLRWREAAWKAATRRGLKVRYAGGRCYVVGAWLIAFLEEHGKDHYQ